MKNGKIAQIRFTYMLNENKVGKHSTYNDLITKVEEHVHSKLTSEEFAEALSSEEIDLVTATDVEGKVVTIYATVETDNEQLTCDEVEDYVDSHFEYVFDNVESVWEEVYEGAEPFEVNTAECLAALTSYDVDVFI